MAVFNSSPCTLLAIPLIPNSTLTSCVGLPQAAQTAPLTLSLVLGGASQPGLQCCQRSVFHSGCAWRHGCLTCRAVGGRLWQLPITVARVRHDRGKQGRAGGRRHQVRRTDKEQFHSSCRANPSEVGRENQFDRQLQMCAGCGRQQGKLKGREQQLSVPPF